jgi:hypothetical protein
LRTACVLRPTARARSTGRRAFGNLQSFSSSTALNFPHISKEIEASGGTLGVIDHIGSYRQFGDSAVTSIDFSLDIQERELQSLVVNSAGKFANLSQQLVLMHLLDIVEQHNQTENPHFYINGVREIFHHFLPDLDLLSFLMSQNFICIPLSSAESSSTCIAF